jgi:hypothetical protein
MIKHMCRIILKVFISHKIMINRYQQNSMKATSLQKKLMLKTDR